MPWLALGKSPTILRENSNSKHSIESGMVTGKISNSESIRSGGTVQLEQVGHWATTAGRGLAAAFRGYWQVPLSTFPANQSNKQGTLGLGVSNAQKLVSTLFSSGSCKSKPKIETLRARRRSMSHNNIPSGQPSASLQPYRIRCFRAFVLMHH